MKRACNETEILARLDDSLAADVLTDAYTSDEVAELINEAGGVAELIGQRGAALVVGLMEQILRSRKAGRSVADRPKTAL